MKETKKGTSGSENRDDSKTRSGSNLDEMQTNDLRRENDDDGQVRGELDARADRGNDASRDLEADDENERAQ